MRDNIRKIIDFYMSANKPIQPYREPAEKESGDIAGEWVKALIETSEEAERRERETDIFRVSYGGLECAYNIKDYRAVAEHLSAKWELPDGLAVEINRKAIT